MLRVVATVLSEIATSAKSKENFMELHPLFNRRRKIGPGNCRGRGNVVRRSLIMLRVLITIIFISCGLVSHASAARKDPDLNALERCIEWCKAHNKTDASRKKCGAQCFNYWNTPRSDGTYNESAPTPALPNASRESSAPKSVK